MLRGRWTTSPGLAGVHHRVPPGTTTPTALPDVPSLSFKQRSGVARGYYGDQLSRGLTIFPREQWLWLEFRAMLADFPAPSTSSPTSSASTATAATPTPAG